MRRLSALLPAAAMFAILAVLLVFMCLPIGQKSAKAVDGAIEINGKSMEASIYQLNGEWEFYYGELLTPSDFVGGRGSGETISVPSAWNREGWPRGGCATYRLVVRTDSNAPLTLFLPEIYSAYILWVNGEAVCGGGVVSPTADGSAATYENALASVQPENGVLELVVQVSNYDFHLSGMTGDFLLGESGNIFSWFLRTRALYCLALGCILMASFYHLTLYVFRRGEKVYLYLAFMCFLCFLRFLFIETNSLGNFMTRRSDWLPVLRTYIFVYYLHSAVILLFGLLIFNRDFLQKHKYGAWTYVAIVCLQALMLPTNTSYTFVVQVCMNFVPAVFAVAMAARSTVLREQTWSRLYFLAMVLYTVIGTVSKVFLENIWFMTGLLTNMFLIMAQSIVLSKDYANAFELVEETNTNLERIVDERTAELVEANKTLGRINQIKSDFMSNMSHEIRTPLTIMSGYAQRARKQIDAGTVNEDTRQGLLTISLEAQRLTMLAEQLLDTSVNQWNASQPCPLNPAAILERTAALCEPILSKNNNRLYTRAEAGCPAIYASESMILQVLVNLCVNANRHMAGGMVTVTIGRTGNMAEFNVVDDGEGMEPELLSHVFERGVSGDGESGLGLPICKEVVESFGGEIRIESEPGKGTRVTFGLPLSETGEVKA